LAPHQVQSGHQPVAIYTSGSRGQTAEPIHPPSSRLLQAMFPYTLTQEFFISPNPLDVIEFSPNTNLLCLGRGDLRLDLVDLATCSTVATIVLESAPSAVLWKYPHFLIVGLKDGSFTSVTVNSDYEVTIGRVYGLGASTHVSAITMSDVHGILVIATGSIVHIYRFEQGTRKFPLPLPITSQ